MNRLARILVTKVSKPILSYDYKFITYVNDINNSARRSPGYLSSQNYWAKERTINNTNCVMTWSLWRNELDFQNWWNSHKREIINKKYQDILEHESFETCINLEISTHNVPLL